MCRRVIEISLQNIIFQIFYRYTYETLNSSEPFVPIRGFLPFAITTVENIVLYVGNTELKIKIQFKDKAHARMVTTVFPCSNGRVSKTK